MELVIIIFIYIYFKKSSRIKRKINKSLNTFISRIEKSYVLIESFDREFSVEISNYQLINSRFEFKSVNNMSTLEVDYKTTMVYKEELSFFRIDIDQVTHSNIEKIKKSIIGDFETFKTDLTNEFGPKYKKFIDKKSLIKEKKRP